MNLHKNSKLNAMLCLGMIVMLTSCGLTQKEKDLIIQRTDSLYQDSDRWDSLKSYASRKDLPSLGETASLNNYLSFALQNNFGLRAEFDRWLSSMYAIPRVRSHPDPKINFTYLLVPIETRTGAQIAQFGLSQIFPWFNNLELQGKIAAKKAEVNWQKLQTKRLEIIRQTTAEYYKYAYLRKSIEINEQSLQLLKQLEPVIQRSIQAGSAQAHLLRLQIEIAKQQDKLDTLIASRKTISTNLKSLLNCNDQGTLPWSFMNEVQTITLDKKSLVDLVLENNPQLKSLREKILLNATATNLAEESDKPNIGVGLNRFETKRSNNPTSGSGRDPLALMFSLTIPIDREKYVAAEKEAQAALRASHADLGQRFNELNASLEILLFTHNNTIRKISLYKNTLIPRAKQNWHLSLVVYKSGKLSVLDLIDSQRTLLKFEDQLWLQQSNYLINTAALEAICGGKIK